MKRVSAVVIATLLLLAVASGQPPAAPKPGPEQKKLEYFTGNWTSEGESKPGPMGPGGKMSMNQEAKWMDGGSFVVIQSSYKTAEGDGTATSFLGYDPQDKVYTYDEFNSQGEPVHAKGTVDGDTWTWTSDMKMGPQTAKGRFTEKILSPTSYNFKFEMSSDGKTWNTMLDGKATKK